MAKVYGRVLSSFLIIYTFYFCAATEIKETEHYDVSLTNLPHIGAFSSIIKLREKRQTPTDLKNQYQSVSQNATTDTKQAQSPQAPAAAATQQQQQQQQQGQSTERSSAETSVVVPFDASDRPLLGTNGTGQRKDSNDRQAKPTVVSNPIDASITSTDATAKKPNAKNPKKVLAAIDPIAAAEEVIKDVDVPENDTITALQNQNFTINQTTDHHNYYNSTIYVSKAEADQIWTNIKNIAPNSMLSQSHRRAMTVELTFDFPFYGHPVRNVTVATGGFLYTGEYVHSWLAATQYIAPLMANFDTSLSNQSYVRISDNGTAFTVIWENVSLQDFQQVGKFTFSTTLHSNGDIVFTYFNVPIFVNAIQDVKHPVKVGLSDAYIIDKVVIFARRKTIYEYHRVNFGHSEITNSTIIYLKALPTCLSYTDCAACLAHETSFECAWCPVLNRCSTGTDRKKQEWLQKGCDRAQITDVAICPALGQKGNNANQTNSDANQSNQNQNGNDNSNTDLTPDTSDPISGDTMSPVYEKTVSKELKAALDDHADSSKGRGLALGFLVPICLVMTVMLWVLYAYRNPHTKSGQLLIQYRPSQWSWRRGEARYTAATIHM